MCTCCWVVAVDGSFAGRFSVDGVLAQRPYSLHYVHEVEDVNADAETDQTKQV